MAGCVVDSCMLQVFLTVYLAVVGSCSARASCGRRSWAHASSLHLLGDWVVTCVASGSSSDISNMSGEEGQDTTDILGVEEKARGSFSREGI